MGGGVAGGGGAGREGDESRVGLKLLWEGHGARGSEAELGSGKAELVW